MDFIKSDAWSPENSVYSHAPGAWYLNLSRWAISSELVWMASTTLWTTKTTKVVIHHQVVVCQGLFRKNESAGATPARQYSIWKESGVGGLSIRSSVLASSCRKKSAKFKCMNKESRAKAIGTGSEVSGEGTGNMAINGLERKVKR